MNIDELIGREIEARPCPDTVPCSQRTSMISGWCDRCLLASAALALTAQERTTAKAEAVINAGDEFIVSAEDYRIHSHIPGEHIGGAVEIEVRMLKARNELRDALNALDSETSPPLPSPLAAGEEPTR